MLQKFFVFGRRLRRDLLSVHAELKSFFFSRVGGEGRCSCSTAGCIFFMLCFKHGTHTWVWISVIFFSIERGT